MTTLAVLAALERRASLLPRVLRSLRPQVDRIHVYLNGWEEPPECVRDLADEYVLDPVNGGAERKLHWAPSHDGVYFSCDDDFEYPADYVARMRDEIDRWDGNAIVTVHGRTYIGNPSKVTDVRPGSVGIYHQTVTQSRWINHGGTGVMAWDASKINVPSEWKLRNILDMQLAIWAQLHLVPMRLLAHRGTWLKPLAQLDPEGIYRSSQKERHARRERLLRAHGQARGWRLFDCSSHSSSP